MRSPFCVPNDAAPARQEAVHVNEMPSAGEAQRLPRDDQRFTLSLDRALAYTSRVRSIMRSTVYSASTRSRPAAPIWRRSRSSRVSRAMLFARSSTSPA